MKQGLRQSRTNMKEILTLICALALLSKPSVVCLVQSGPSGIRTFKRSKHRRRWARLQKTTKVKSAQPKYCTRNLLKPILRQIIIHRLLSLYPFYTPNSSVAKYVQVQARLLVFGLYHDVCIPQTQSLQITLPRGNLCQRCFIFKPPHKLSPSVLMWK